MTSNYAKWKKLSGRTCEGRRPTSVESSPNNHHKEIIYNWKRQAAGRFWAALAKASTIQSLLSPRLCPLPALLWRVLADSGRGLEGEKIHGSPKRGQLGFTLASFVTSSLTVSLCWNILENYPRQIFGNVGLRDFLMKDIPLRASLNIDSSEEVCSWGNADGYWKLIPSSAILIWVDMDMQKFPKFLLRSPMSSLDKAGRGPLVSPTLSSLLPLPDRALSFLPTHFATDMTEKHSPSFDWGLNLPFPCLETTNSESAWGWSHGSIFVPRDKHSIISAFACPPILH